MVLDLLHHERCRIQLKLEAYTAFDEPRSSEHRSTAVMLAAPASRRRSLAAPSSAFTLAGSGTVASSVSR
ncbi:hypothetical protein A7982_13227 [Minicystis rosea]|nr:hypothetical protein A7982_13227 [Minicystis rosea]